jgi:hypothetical protein
MGNKLIQELDRAIERGWANGGHLGAIRELAVELQPQPYHWDGVNPPVPLAAPQAQAEPVAVVMADGYPLWLASWLNSPSYRSLPAGTKLYTAPQPQAAHDAAALAKRLDEVLGCYADSMPKEAYFEVDAVMRALNAAPQPQSSPSPSHRSVASIIGEAMSIISENVAPQHPPQPQAEPVAWRELCRRLYVELFHCDQQMMSARKNGKPMWTQGADVRDALRDAKAALNAAPQPQAEPVALIQWAEKSEPENHPWAAGYEAAREYVRMQLRAAPQPQAAEGLTVKEAWWAGARAALGLPGETPREQVASAFVIAGILAKRDEQAPQPSPQASAEDVALVDKWVNLAHTREIEAWDRIRASLGVGK